MWDIGGQREIRPYWQNYYEDISAIIYVIDSSDENRMDEVKQNLVELLAEEKLRNVTLLVFANKQDHELACDAGEVSYPPAIKIRLILDFVSRIFHSKFLF